MAFAPLSRGLKLGPEDTMAVQFANTMRAAVIEGRLRAIFVHPANELAYGHKNGVKAAIARALGMHIGCPDYWFIWDGGGAVLEAKSENGSLTPNQRDFREWAEARRVPHHVFRTVEEGVGILRTLGVLD